MDRWEDVGAVAIAREFFLIVPRGLNEMILINMKGILL